MEKADNIGYKIRLLHNQVHKHIEYKKENNEYDISDLTRMQRFTMGFLHQNRDREVYQRDLEAEFAISRATASNMLAVMERKGLIKREPVVHDARLKKLVLTEQAKQMHRQVEQDIRETEELLTNGMSEDDKRRLHQYLDIMIQNLVEDLGDCTTTCCGKEPE
ncbi:MAG: MarR family transcriptional regulator [Roseburia sp.]|nr:MarR family transcriptional regulator [Roseburia sp.]